MASTRHRAFRIFAQLWLEIIFILSTSTSVNKSLNKCIERKHCQIHSYVEKIFFETFFRKLMMGLYGVLLIALLLGSCQAEMQRDPEDSVPEDSSSVELQVVRQQRSENTLQAAQNRPILEFVLGVLDTFHSSAQSELKRIKTRHARHNHELEEHLKQQQYVQTTATSTSPASSTGDYEKNTSTTKKRFSNSRQWLHPVLCVLTWQAIVS